MTRFIMDWTSVADRLPEEGIGNVLVANNLGTRLIMEYDGRDWIGWELKPLRQMNAESRFGPIRITHWMPLPPAPKK